LGGRGGGGRLTEIFVWLHFRVGAPKKGEEKENADGGIGVGVVCMLYVCIVLYVCMCI